MKNCKKTFVNLLRDDKGNVLIMVGVFILVTFAIAGAAVDFGRAQLLRMKTQQASDLAALSAALILDKTKTNAHAKQVRSDAATRYYNLNFPTTYLGVTRTAPSYDYNTSSGDITVSSTGTIATNYVTTMGTSHINIRANTKVNIPDNNQPDFDVAMVIDESGSTNRDANGNWGGKPSTMDMEKDALAVMIDALFPDGQPQNDNLRFGLVGYSGPIVHAYGLTSDKSKAKNYVKNLDWYYQNYDHWGLEAGFNMVTGVWNGFTAPYSCGVHQSSACVPQRNTGVPIPESTRNDGKLLSDNGNIVFITDGYIMEEPAPCIIGVWYRTQYPTIDQDWPQAGDKCRNYQAFLRQCDAIKAAGVTIYTINFISQSWADITPMTACASSPDKYYYAPTGNKLKKILKGIANQIRTVRIVN